ncbi:hypothetical protein NE645_17220, partial [Roseburia hominis]|nr:hypothetical protein [Roseburia hominis]
EFLLLSLDIDSIAIKILRPQSSQRPLFVTFDRLVTLTGSMSGVWAAIYLMSCIKMSLNQATVSIMDFPFIPLRKENFIPLRN